MTDPKLVAKLRKDFPLYQITHTFEAAIPLYAIQIVMEVLEQRKLNPFQSYLLQFMDLGVQTLEECAYLLGVDEQALFSSVTNLLKLNYIEERLIEEEPPKTLLALTPSGKVALEREGPPPVPARTTGRFSWNALIWKPFQQEEHLLYPDEAAKAGLVTLPASETEKPTLGTFTDEDIKLVFKDAPGFQQKTITSLLKLKSALPRYIGPVTVAVLQHRETNEKTIAIYREGVQQGPETAVLQRLYEAKRFDLPTEALSPREEQPIPVPTSLDLGIAQEIQQRVKQERALEEIEIQVETNKIQKSATQDAREREELELQFQKLQTDLRQKSQEISQLNHQLLQRNIEFLQTEQHHSRLLRALREAKEEIIIITPRLNRFACNEEVRNLMVAAIVRGVHLRIGYGIGNERNQEVANRDHYEIEEIKKAIKNALPSATGNTALDDIVETAGTHQKILICDRRYAIAGSFNWLSYLGKRDRGYRRELSAVFQQREVVDELASIALQTWKTRSAASLTSAPPRRRNERRP